MKHTYITEDVKILFYNDGFVDIASDTSGHIYLSEEEARAVMEKLKEHFA